MPIQQSETERALLFITAVTAWFALVLQLFLAIDSDEVPLTETIIRYFSFFMTWINIIVAICCTALFISPSSSFFRNPRVITAVAVYFSTGALLYNFVLRELWNPEGIVRVADELLHLVVPALFLLYWLLFTPKAQLQWRDIWAWLILPLTYIMFVFLIGRISGFYPYPFIDINTNGIDRVVLNCVYIAAGLLLCACLFIGIGKLTRFTAREE